jgi:hypothetical protein
MVLPKRNTRFQSMFPLNMHGFLREEQLNQSLGPQELFQLIENFSSAQKTAVFI